MSRDRRRRTLIVLRPGQAEVAFAIAIAVIDAYRGQSIGTSLMMRHLVAIARAAGLQELIAEVLPDNTRC